ncbi:MAG: Tol-Pal system beta propeller repeat protein TolB [Thermodesulfobacteriota bacterium]|nr:Tol-Pal system beta propeller repeat protein TolB [Thermodesulfobacteriota bacterium]
MSLLRLTGVDKVGVVVVRIIAALVFLICLLPGVSTAGYDYINISNPFLFKIPVAVPVFKAMTHTPAPNVQASTNGDTGPASLESAIARDAADLLAGTLVFTRYFEIIDRAAFIEEPAEKGITLEEVNCKNWRDIEAEFLITGGVSLRNDVMSLELRLIDVFKERMLIGKKYKGRASDQRTMVRRFCSEIMKRFTGGPGIFESRIAFVSTGTGHKEIYTCDFDGYNPQQLTHDNSINLSPAWSADGRWLAYTSYRKGHPDLYIKHLTENRGVVFSRDGVNISPAWKPDAFSLAATLSFSGDQEIYLLTGTGKILKQLTRSWGIDVSPTFAPDGERIAFVSNRSGSPQIYIQDIASGATQRLTFEGGYNTTPDWAPKKNRIAYCAMEAGEFNIKVIDIETKEIVGLTGGQGDNESPSWSPDGSLIAFSSTREGGVPKIFVMSAAGTDQKRLLNLPGKQTCPRWSPSVAAGE